MRTLIAILTLAFVNHAFANDEEAYSFEKRCLSLTRDLLTVWELPGASKGFHDSRFWKGNTDKKSHRFYLNNLTMLKSKNKELAGVVSIEPLSYEDLVAKLASKSLSKQLPVISKDENALVVDGSVLLRETLKSGSPIIIRKALPHEITLLEHATIGGTAHEVLQVFLVKSDGSGKSYEVIHGDKTGVSDDVAGLTPNEMISMIAWGAGEGDILQIHHVHPMFDINITFQDGRESLDMYSFLSNEDIAIAQKMANTHGMTVVITAISPLGIMSEYIAEPQS